MDTINDPTVHGIGLCVAVAAPSGTEVITTMGRLNVSNKLEYYQNAYDEEFRLRTCKDVRIVGFMLF